MLKKYKLDICFFAIAKIVCLVVIAWGMHRKYKFQEVSKKLCYNMRIPFAIFARIYSFS